MAVVMALLFASAMATNAWATGIKTIVLQHQTAAHVIPLITPLLPANTALSGHNNLLFIRTNAASFKAIQAFVKTLDTPPVLFLIRVRRGTSSDAWLRRTSRLYQTTSKDDQQSQQWVRVVSGQSAVILLSKEIPVVRRVSLGDGSVEGGVSLERDYKTLTSGVVLTPRLLGKDRVQITLAAPWERSASSNASQIARNRLTTTLTVPFGQWVSLGGVTDNAVSRRNTRVYTTGSRTITQSTIWIRVERAEPITKSL